MAAMDVTIGECASLCCVFAPSEAWSVFMFVSLSCREGMEIILWGVHVRL